MAEPWDISQQLRHRRRVLPFRRATVRVEMGLLDVRWISSKINLEEGTSPPPPPFLYFPRLEIISIVKDRGKLFPWKISRISGMAILETAKFNRLEEGGIQFSTQLTRTITSRPACEIQRVRMHFIRIDF